MDGTDNNPKVPSRPLLHLLVLGAILVPLTSIPYLPIRRHLLSLGRSIHAVSTNVTDIQRGFLTKADIYNGEITALTNEIRDLRLQLNAATHKTTDSENARVKFQRQATKQLCAASLKLRQTEEAAKRQIRSLKAQIDRERIPRDILLKLSASLGDTAAFFEETEIQLGWSHAMTRDRGVDKLRTLALKLHRHAAARETLDSKR